VVVRLENPGYRGSQPSLPNRDFAVISNNVESTSAQALPGCEYNAAWNAWQCTDDNIGVLIFDSRDADRMDRASQPIYI
jgi:hypothetical protein